MTVGALDAYFCDAYIDCVALRLQSFKAGEMEFPDAYDQLNLPAAALLDWPLPPDPVRMFLQSLLGHGTDDATGGILERSLASQSA